MTSLRTGPSTRGLARFYIVAVCILIAFLGYFSQYLLNADPDLSPLSRHETLTFNALLACVWCTYYYACTVNPGRYIFPPTATTSSSDHADPDLRAASASASVSPTNRRRRWCKKCNAPKPPRAHHCRHCGRCIPKMDHHCPWTGTCVSMQTFPYFLRFIVYANLALWYLAGLLARRVAAVWADRHLPAYLGPSVSGLVGLTVLVLLSAATAFALGVMLYTSVKAWVFNRTLIEEWEMERHEAVLARVMEADEDGDGDEEEDDDGGRGRKAKGNFWGDDDVALRELMERIEFPYDLGVFANMAQAMGTRNPLRWFLPVFGGGPVINNDTPGKGSGWEWEENGFNDLPGLWPPPDPEKARRERQGGWPGAAAQQLEKRFDDYRTAEEVKAAFARRQAEDFRRRQMAQAQTRQESKIIAELEEVDELNTGAPSNRGEDYEWVGKPSWTNSEGDRLWDYGVDEDVDVEENFVNPPAGKDDDDVPLAELIRRRKVLTREEDG